MKKVSEDEQEKIPWHILWDEGRTKLGTSELTLLSYLLSIDRGAKYGGVCASIPQIQAATGLSRTTLHVAKRELERKGLIKILGRRNSQNVNAYDLGPVKRKLHLIPAKDETNVAVEGVS